MKQVRKLYNILVGSIFMIKHNYTAYGGYVRFMRTIAIGLFVVSLWGCNRVNNNTMRNCSNSSDGRSSFPRNEASTSSKTSTSSVERDEELELAEGVSDLISALVGLLPEAGIIKYFPSKCIKGIKKWGRIGVQITILLLLAVVTDLGYSFCFSGYENPLPLLWIEAASEIENFSSSMLFNMTADWRGDCRSNLTSLPEEASYTLGVSYYNESDGSKYVLKNMYHSVNSSIYYLTNMQKETLNHTLNEAFHYVQQGYSPCLVVGGSAGISFAAGLVFTKLYDILIDRFVATYDYHCVFKKKEKKKEKGGVIYDFLNKLDGQINKCEAATQNKANEKVVLRGFVNDGLPWILTIVSRIKETEKMQKLQDQLYEVFRKAKILYPEKMREIENRECFKFLIQSFNTGS
ncbi:MAG: hypothetical protein NQ127_02475 [Candidatus Cardinium sp.]|nr:hypothetical protein [Candidatus Cardinium sp.]